MTPQGSDASRPNAASGTAYGVDGCSAGWFYFALARSGAPDWGIASTIKELVSSADDSDRIFVDIPIGLPDGPGGTRVRYGGAREAESASCEQRVPGAGAHGAICGDVRGGEPSQPGGKRKGADTADLRDPAEDQGSGPAVTSEREGTAHRARDPP